MPKYSRGDRVIYYDEVAPNPGGTGDETIYIVPHYMTVREACKRGTVVLLMQGGQMHVTRNTDPNLRRARWWEKLLYRDRFPRLSFW